MNKTVSFLLVCIVFSVVFGCNLESDNVTEGKNDILEESDPARASGDYFYLRIERIVQINNPDGGKAGDYYATGSIDGTAFTTKSTSNTTDISPYWLISKRLTHNNRITVVINIYDDDGSSSADDLCDVNPADGTKGIYFFYYQQSGTITGCASTTKGSLIKLEGAGDSNKAAIWLRMDHGPAGTLKRPYSHPSNHKYLGNHPSNRENSLSNELQGVTHDDNYWYITKVKQLWKIPVTYNLKDVTKADSSKGIYKINLNVGNLNHFGDPAYFLGHIFVPAYVEKEPDLASFILVYRASDLKYIGGTVILGPSGDMEDLTPSLGWVAIHPIGFLYTSHSTISPENPVLRYFINPVSLLNGEINLTYLGKLDLHHELGGKMTIRCMQGGTFDSAGMYLYLTSGYYKDNYKHDGINVFNAFSGDRVAHSNQGYGNFNYQFKPEDGNEEPEGLTYWDLTDGRAPGIDGCLHVMMLDLDAGDDDMYFKHYTDGKLLY